MRAKRSCPLCRICDYCSTMPRYEHAPAFTYAEKNRTAQQALFSRAQHLLGSLSEHPPAEALIYLVCDTSAHASTWLVGLAS